MPTRDLEKDLALCEDAAGISLESHNPIGRIVQFANIATVGWPCAIQRALDAERENDRLRNELQIYQEQDHRSKPYD